jgi:hypothetical protein
MVAADKPDGGAALADNERMRNTTLLLLAVLAPTASTGCSSDENPSHPDAALADAALADARTDAGAPDAAPPDAGGDLCDLELPCPAPDADRFMICGRLIDLETSQLITGPTASLVQVSFYDALAFAQNPLTAPEFSVTPDACGRFVSSSAGHHGVAVPDTMYIAIGVDDVGTPFPGGDFVSTGGLAVAEAGGKKSAFHAYTTHETTAAAWSGAMSPSLVEQGVFAGIFIDTSKPPVGIYNGTPAQGVKLTADVTVVAAKDFYFDDAGALLRSHIGSLDAAGADGTALFVQGSLQSYSGAGGTSAGCSWPSAFATTSPNAILVNEYESTCP